nr:hypothetical protein CFP56_21226 [Quercus suber]
MKTVDWNSVLTVISADVNINVTQPGSLSRFTKSWPSLKDKKAATEALAYLSTFRILSHDPFVAHLTDFVSAVEHQYSKELG